MTAPAAAGGGGLPRYEVGDPVWVQVGTRQELAAAVVVALGPLKVRIGRHVRPEGVGAVTESWVSLAGLQPRHQGHAIDDRYPLAVAQRAGRGA